MILMNWLCITKLCLCNNFCQEIFQERINPIKIFKCRDTASWITADINVIPCYFFVSQKQLNWNLKRMFLISKIDHYWAWCRSVGHWYQNWTGTKIGKLFFYFLSKNYVGTTTIDRMHIFDWNFILYAIRRNLTKFGDIAILTFFVIKDIVLNCWRTDFKIKLLFKKSLSSFFSCLDFVCDRGYNVEWRYIKVFCSQ